MVNTLSQMVPLGLHAPDFKLPSPINQQSYSLNDLKSECATVIIFMCNHCPFVIHLIEKLVELSNHYGAKGVQFIAINSNDVDNYPMDSPEKMKEFVEHYNINFPYLFDESQQVAKAYSAACTPDFFIFNKELSLVYRGQFDNSRPGNKEPINGDSLKSALDSLLSEKPMSSEQKPSIGCNIKWKSI